MILISSISICPSNITVTKGKWYYGVYPEIYPSNAMCSCVTWHSSNSNIASVNQSGYICGISEGSAVIYATAQDGSGAVGFCNVTVEAPILVSDINVTPSTKIVKEGDVFGLTATVTPANATDSRIRWSSCDCNIADVDYLTGCVTAKKAGTTCIYAEAIDGNGINGCCHVTVQRRVLVSSVNIAPANKTMVVGSAIVLRANVSPSNATNKSIKWSSSDENIATVDSVSGYVVAKNPGTTNIWAFSQDGSNQYMNCPITVNNVDDIYNDSWDVMGFKYDGSQRDITRLNQGLPPYSYEQWILNGRQKVIFLCDYDDIPLAGHACLLIRSDAGVWYKTQFRGKKPIDSYIECVVISEERKNQYLVQENMETLFLYGDYRESLRKAEEIRADTNNNYNGKYDLFNNNCLHYVNEILSYGDNINDDVDEYVATNQRDVPHAYYNDLKDILGL